MPLTLGGIELPDDLLWSDEFAYTAITQAQNRTLGGGLILEETETVAGRPITLQGGEDYAWATRTTVVALRTLAEAAGATHPLELPDGRTFTVAFRRGSSTPAIDARPIVPYNTPADGDFYVLTVFLIEV